MLSNRKQCLTVLCLTALSLAFISCEKEAPDEQQGFEFITQVRETVIAELIVNDLESLVLNSIINLDLQDPGGQIATHVDANIFSVRGNCAREIDVSQNSMTIDLSSCSDSFDILRDGELIIDYEDAFDEPGNTINVRMNNYRYENISISGDFAIQNTSEPNSEVKNYSIEFPKTSFILANSTESFTLSGSRNIEVFENTGSAIRNPDLQSIAEASWNINEDDASAFTISTSTPLQHRLDCWSEGFYFPRGGIQLVTGQGYNFNLNYYKTSCGWEFEVTDGDLISQDFTLQELFFD